MNDYTHDFADLVARARKGDPAAAARLRQVLEPQMVRIVGRALRSTSPSTALTRRIREEAQRATSTGWQPADDDPSRLAAHVAGRLCSNVVRRLRTTADTFDPLLATSKA